jgi:hypothetical protein
MAKEANEMKSQNKMMNGRYNSQQQNHGSLKMSA